MYSFSVFCSLLSFFFFNDTATTEIYTLSLHDALPISLLHHGPGLAQHLSQAEPQHDVAGRRRLDRKSTRLNSSHTVISYAVFCLKKKKKDKKQNTKQDSKQGAKAQNRTVERK